MLNAGKILGFLMCLLLTALVVVSTKGIHYLWSESRATGGFDYSQVLDNERFIWTGPKVDEKIEINNFRGKDGSDFPHLTSKNLIMLSFLSSKCEMVKLSSDQMQYVHSQALKNNIDYYFISLGTNETPTEFFNFVETLPFPAKSFIWTDKTENLSANLIDMVVPSHILINNDGVVLRRFPGTRIDKNLRDKMANQIVSEMLEEKAKLEVAN